MVKKNDEVKSFDLETALKDLSVPNMFREGLKTYIEVNDLTVKDEKDFEKLVKSYTNLKY